MNQTLPLSPASRLGFHYFPDTLHYREQDLQTWLPELRAMGASWVTLVAPVERAIPEPFITGLIAQGIEPILHFHIPLHSQVTPGQLAVLLANYARWGVRYACLFDRPNTRRAWSTAGWTQTDLVERFLDRWVPLAESVLQTGLLPVFPPLEPGGDYWDTAFLRAALRSLERRGARRLLESLVLGAHAQTCGRPLNWGAGGPERWPGARPYIETKDCQDQRGFYIFDWYLAIAEAELGKRLPILLLSAGSQPDLKSQTGTAGFEAQVAQAQQNLKIARLLMGDDLEAEGLPPVPEEVLSCSFWLLSATAGSPFTSQAWFHPEGAIPAVDALKGWMATAAARPSGGDAKHVREGLPSSHNAEKAIDHYLLLPLYAWGAAAWDLELVQAFVQRHHPTLGFSQAEAEMASRVTLLAREQAYPAGIIEKLQAAGCTVERLDENGMLLATSTADQQHMQEELTGKSETSSRRALQPAMLSTL